MIKTENFTEPTESSPVSEDEFENLCAEKKALSTLIDVFADRMKDKLFEKYDEGWNGWDQEKYRYDIETSFADQVTRKEKDYVDIANFAAMLWNFDQTNEDAE